MAINSNRDRDGAFLVQSFMTGEQKIMLSLEISEFDRRSESKKSDAIILSGVNSKSCTKSCARHFDPSQFRKGWKSKCSNECKSFGPANLPAWNRNPSREIY
jgi:hypothetical protein